MPGLDHVRSQSLFGLSDVKCYFNWGIDYKDARQEVINRLQFVQLPTGAAGRSSRRGTRSARSSATALVGKGYTLKDLKTAEDWILERQFKQVPGVIDVDELRRRDQAVPRRGRSLSPARPGRDAHAARSTRDRERQPERRRPAPHRSASSRYNVRGIGLIEERSHDIEQRRRRRAEGHARPRARRRATWTSASRRASASSATTTTPTSCRASSSCATAARRRTTLEGVHERVDYIRKNHLLPPGMDIVPYYDRGKLVKLTTHTVIENLSSAWASSRSCSSSSSATCAPRSSPRSTSRSRCSSPSSGMVGDGHAGEPHLARRGRLRHRRRLHRHHDGEHLPAPRPARERHDARAHPGRRARGRRRR